MDSFVGKDFYFDYKSFDLIEEGKKVLGIFSLHSVPKFMSKGDEINVYTKHFLGFVHGSASLLIRDIKVIQASEITLEQIKLAGYENEFEFTVKCMVPNRIDQSDSVALVYFTRDKLFNRLVSHV